MEGKEETFPEIIPVRIDLRTVAYPTREKVEECGGVEGYIRRFNEKRSASKGDMQSLFE